MTYERQSKPYGQRGAEIVAEPELIFRHLDDKLGPAGTDEWMAFVKDSEGNTVGLVSHYQREHS
jgi:methylmalonyl-CoA/ethylmalonyl-CoA epimerase